MQTAPREGSTDPHCTSSASLTRHPLNVLRVGRQPPAYTARSTHSAVCRPSSLDRDRPVVRDGDPVARHGVDQRVQQQPTWSSSAPRRSAARRWVRLCREGRLVEPAQQHVQRGLHDHEQVGRPDLQQPQQHRLRAADARSARDQTVWTTALLQEPDTGPCPRRALQVLHGEPLGRSPRPSAGGRSAAGHRAHRSRRRHRLATTVRSGRQHLPADPCGRRRGRRHRQVGHDRLHAGASERGADVRRQCRLPRAGQAAQLDDETHDLGLPGGLGKQGGAYLVQLVVGIEQPRVQPQHGNGHPFQPLRDPSVRRPARP